MSTSLNDAKKKFLKLVEAGDDHLASFADAFELDDSKNKESQEILIGSFIAFLSRLDFQTFHPDEIDLTELYVNGDYLEVVTTDRDYDTPGS